MVLPLGVGLTTVVRKFKSDDVMNDWLVYFEILGNHANTKNELSLGSKKWGGLSYFFSCFCNFFPSLPHNSFPSITLYTCYEIIKIEVSRVIGLDIEIKLPHHSLDNDSIDSNVWKKNWWSYWENCEPLTALKCIFVCLRVFQGNFLVKWSRSYNSFLRCFQSH